MRRWPSQNKYRNNPEVINGIRFASQLEAKRYTDLKMLSIAGVITGLELQPKYPLIINGIWIATYISDYQYYEGTQLIVEDAKGQFTPDGKMKFLLAQALYADRTFTTYPRKSGDEAMERARKRAAPRDRKQVQSRD